MDFYLTTSASTFQCFRSTGCLHNAKFGCLTLATNLQHNNLYDVAYVAMGIFMSDIRDTKGLGRIYRHE